MAEIDNKGRVVYQLLKEAERPLSKVQIAAHFGINLNELPHPRTDHDTLIKALDFLLRTKQILTAFCADDPPESDVDSGGIIGPGTYGFYPTSKDEGYLQEGIVHGVFVGGSEYFENS